MATGRFIRIKDVIIQEDYISHVGLPGFSERDPDGLFIAMKSGMGFMFMPIAASFNAGAKKGDAGYHYLTEEEFKSLVAYLKGDFSHGVA